MRVDQRERYEKIVKEDEKGISFAPNSTLSQASLVTEKMTTQKAFTKT